MGPKVNRDLCIGCGTCISLCPDVFELRDDHKSHVIKNIEYKEHESCINESIDVCPVQAISVE